MNKITSALAGLALAAGVGVAPAFAQAPTPGYLFSPTGGGSGFTFSGLGTASFIATSGSVGFNFVGGTANTTASFALTGTQVSGILYQVTSLVFTPAGGVANIEVNPLQFTVFALPSGAVSVASAGSASDGTGFTLLSAPVPESSTTASLGLLLALGAGGLALTAKRRKSAPPR